ncbi:MAG: NADPH:quinone oxidoreductase family protein [Alphaproteobacteria bacterium]|nr:NADPH:quinone oxidoreductase family protein [Alphaproteobacteria bacterium]
MRGVQANEFGGPEKLRIEDIPEPKAGKGEIVVRPSAVGLNFFDTLVLRNRYQVTPSLPFSPGAEIAGKIDSLGPGVSGLEVGQRIMAFVGGNGCREKVTVEASAAVSIPDGVSDDAAAAIPVTYGTALHAFKDRAALKMGESVAVLGAAGGAGLAAVEIAKLMGARVIAVASSAEKIAVARAHGADEGVDYATEDLKTRLKELTGQNGVDVLYDAVGGDYAEPALRAMAWEGRYLVIGFASGAIPRLPLNVVMLKGCAIIGVHWSAFVKRDLESHRANMELLLKWCKEGSIVPHIHQRFALADTAKALSLIEERKVTGRVIVNPQA